MILACSAEDDAALAVSDLQRVEQEAAQQLVTSSIAACSGPSAALHLRMLLVGVSCGFSATYVGAQLQVLHA